MKYDEAQEIFTLETTGREIIANRGVLGVSANQDTGYLFQGYDGLFVEFTCEYSNPPQLTKTEKQEIALYMMRLWFNWARKGEEE
jgi:hypothetical protein